MKHRGKWFISLLLMLCMVFALMTTMALAAGDDVTIQIGSAAPVRVTAGTDETHEGVPGDKLRAFLTAHAAEIAGADIVVNVPAGKWYFTQDNFFSGVTANLPRSITFTGAGVVRANDIYLDCVPTVFDGVTVKSRVHGGWLNAEF